MSDIVERLRDRMMFGLYWEIARDAADEITLLRQQLASARDAALEEAARIGDDESKKLVEGHLPFGVAAGVSRLIRSLKSGQEGKR